MPRKTAWPPRVYPRNGQDIVRLYLGPGRYRDITLGPSDSKEARAEYLRIVAEVEALGRVRLDEPDLTVLELVTQFIDFAGTKYDRRQLGRFKVALKPAVALYGHTRADAFGPLALKAVRLQWVKHGYCRRVCNQLTHCVRRAFRWAAGEELVPAAVVAALGQVDAIRKNDPGAPADRPKVTPVPPALLEATLPHLWPEVADMVRLQQYTGMRPGEACALRAGDVDRGWRVIDGVEVWLYRPGSHKGDWRGAARDIPIGPKAQEVLLPYLARRGPEEHVFSPAEAKANWYARRRAARKSKVQPSQVSRKKARPKKQAGDRWTTQSYGRSIRAACERAGLEVWAPNRVRHLVGTEVETEYGREDARCVLGHTTPSTTAIYAESTERAARVVAKIG